MESLKESRFTYRVLESEKEKSIICTKILKALPEWFELEEGIVEYSKKVKTTYVVAAEIDHQVVGFISIRKINPYTSEVYVMGVLKEYQGHGIGKELLNVVSNYLVTQKVKFLSVKTLGPSSSDQYYKKTREFYKKNKFYPIEELTSIWGEDNPCVIMAKHIG